SRIGREGHAARTRVVVERLDPKPVTGEEQDAVLAIPESEGEHAVQSLDTLGAPGRVRLQHDLSVRLGSEAVTEQHQFTPNLPEVVDLTVVGNPQSPAVGGYRLGPTVDID